MAARHRATRPAPEAPSPPEPDEAAPAAPAPSPSPDAGKVREPVRVHRVSRPEPVRAGGYVLTERGWELDTAGQEQG